MTYIDLDKVFGKNVTNEELNAAGFFKVEHDGGTYVTAHYYNPKTDEEGSLLARDYDYDGGHDNDSVYYASIDKESERTWRHRKGEILEGDQIMVIKGRKVPTGTLHTVHAKRKVYDKYGRYVALYLVFDDGLATNEDNCIRVFATENIA